MNVSFRLGEETLHDWVQGSKQQDSSLRNGFASVSPGVKMRYSLLLLETYSL